MAVVPTVALDDWKPLYDAAASFGLCAPWEWMDDGDLFAVLNPAKDEAGYCCVLGNAREVFGLSVYLGSEGLSAYERMQNGAGSEDEYLELARIQNCLLLTFDSSADLDKQDKAVIKSLGLKFKGRNAWPLFRSHRPDCAPWFLEAEEARFLTVALQQAVDVALRFKENPLLRVPPKAGAYFLRAQMLENGSRRWEDRWLEPKPYEPPELPPPKLNELQAAKTLKAAPKQSGQWEVELLTMPAPIMDQDRPYYARFLMCADTASGYIICTEALTPHHYRDAVAATIMAAMEKIGVRPQSIALRQKEIEALLAPSMRLLSVGLSRADVLSAVDEAKESMFAYLRGGM